MNLYIYLLFLGKLSQLITARSYILYIYITYIYKILIRMLQVLKT